MSSRRSAFRLRSTPAGTHRPVPSTRRPARRHPTHAGVACGLCCALLLAACSPYRPRTPAGPPLLIPDAYHHSQVGHRQVGEWWREFDDPKLNTAMQVAFVDNFELRQVWSRLGQAHAQARIDGAELYPQLELGAGAARLHSVDRDARDPHDNRITRTTNPDRYFVATGLRYEIDVWQRIASRRQAARLEYAATREDVEATALLLSGTVANVWFAAQAQHALLELLNEQIEVSRTLLDLTELRFGMGTGSAVDVLQQRQQLTDTQARVPVIRARLDTTLNLLAVLLGRPPGALDELAPDRLQRELPTFPRLITPSDLLASRPDLRAAQLRVQAADYRVASTIAERLPRLALNLSYEFSARSWDTLFRQEIGAVLGELLAPLVDGGRRRNEVLRRKAIVQELLDGFAHTYLAALQEIEDALVREREQRDLLANLERQRMLAESTLDVSRARYVHGLLDYLNVLIAVQSLQSLQRRIISEQRVLLSIRAELYRALGGSWTERLQAPDAIKRIAPTGPSTVSMPHPATAALLASSQASDPGGQP